MNKEILLSVVLACDEILYLIHIHDEGLLDLCQVILNLFHVTIILVCER